MNDILNNIDKDNSYYRMAQAGSKGSEKNML